MLLRARASEIQQRTHQARPCARQVQGGWDGDQRGVVLHKPWWADLFAVDQLPRLQCRWAHVRCSRCGNPGSGVGRVWGGCGSGVVRWAAHGVATTWVRHHRTCDVWPALSRDPTGEGLVTGGMVPSATHKKQVFPRKCIAHVPVLLRDEGDDGAPTRYEMNTAFLSCTIGRLRI